MRERTTACGRYNRLIIVSYNIFNETYYESRKERFHEGENYCVWKAEVKPL